MRLSRSRHAFWSMRASRSSWVMVLLSDRGRGGGDEFAGVGRGGADLTGLEQVDEFARAHDGEAVGDLAHEVEVVGDEQVGGAVLAPELEQKLDDGGLHGDVERGGDLVADDEARAGGEGAGDGDTLLLAAGELVRVAR